MMPSVNKMVLVGHLGRDPEMKTTPNGKTVCHFSIATNEKWGDNEETSWHRIVAWGKLAEICQQYLHKGDAVYIEGRMTYRKWEGEDGAQRETAEVVAREMVMLGNRGEPRQGGDDDQKGTAGRVGDDIPF